MFTSLLEKPCPIRRGALQRPGEHVKGAGGVKVKIDEIRRLHVCGFLNIVQDLATAQRARSVLAVDILTLDLRHSLAPFSRSIGQNGEWCRLGCRPLVHSRLRRSD